MTSELIRRLGSEISDARAAADRWLLLTFSYSRNGHVAYGADSAFVDFAYHRELRGPRWRDFDNARTFADIGHRFVVAGPLSMAILAKHLLDGGRPIGVMMHCNSVARWAPECGKPSPVINSVHGFIGEASPLYASLGARRLRGTQWRKLKTRCYYCSSTNNLTLHHLFRREMGGANEPENLLCVCRDCHDRIHRKEIDDQDLVWQFSLRRTDNILKGIRDPKPADGA